MKISLTAAGATCCNLLFRPPARSNRAAESPHTFWFPGISLEPAPGILEGSSLIYRVLLVDDYEPWCRRIRSWLEQSPKWQVVGEAADGADAVHKATALRPDL